MPQTMNGHDYEPIITMKAVPQCGSTRTPDDEFVRAAVMKALTDNKAWCATHGLEPLPNGGGRWPSTQEECHDFH